MHVKITTSGGRRYVQLVESYRDDAGRVKKRTVATLGRLDQLDGGLDSVIKGLLKVSGREAMAVVPPTPTVSFESARVFGDVWTLTELWKSLGFSELKRVFRRTRHTIDVEALIRVMVFNRLCDPESKLGVLRWLETVALPEVEVKAITHQHLLRSMDALMDQHEAVDNVVAGLLRPMIDQDLSVVFYDLTTIRAEGLRVCEKIEKHSSTTNLRKYSDFQYFAAARNAPQSIISGRRRGEVPPSLAHALADQFFHSL